MTISKDDVENFLQFLDVVKNSSVHTIRGYETDLREYLSFSDHKLDKDAIRGFLAKMYGKGNSKKTIARKLSSIRSFSKFLAKSGKLLSSKNPALEVGTPKIGKHLPKPLNYDQVVDFFSAPDVSDYLGFRDRCIMEVLYSCGVRVSELCLLDRKDFDPASLVIKVRGKGKKERIVPITKVAAEWVVNYLSHPMRYLNSNKHKMENDPRSIFLNRWGTRLTTRSVDRMFAQYRRKTKIAMDITPHTLRHTIATHFLENGMDLKTIQEILGHSSLSTTTIYTSVSSELKRKNVEKFFRDLPG